MPAGIGTSAGLGVRGQVSVTQAVAFDSNTVSSRHSVHQCQQVLYVNHWHALVSLVQYQKELGLQTI